jgi:hypothetical protein
LRFLPFFFIFIFKHLFPPWFETSFMFL